MEYGEAGVFFSFEETSEELAQNVASLGFDLNRLCDSKLLALDHMKIIGITSLFTSLTAPGLSLEKTEVGISSLADTWLLLRDIEIGGGSAIARCTPSSPGACPTRTRSGSSC
jgi:hypothetical protein